MQPSSSQKNAEAERRDAAQAAAGRAASPHKDTDDPDGLPTLNGPPLPAPIGQPARLLGEYEVLERLGSGGMGEVYKARHRRLDKLVALKLLPVGSQSSCEMAVRFQREMKAVGALDHANVVEAHDAGEQSGVIYLAMKLIDGVDLERIVNQRGPLPIAEACEMVLQAALGLQYLHERGLIHRDVKPSNLMRTPEGTVKVLDLGLARWRIEAKAGHSLTAAGRVMGTPDFLAPEQIENVADADARADLYGLGGTLFYLLTGRVLFADSKSVIAKLDAHRFQPPPDLRTLRPEVPADLAALVHRLLAKKPEDRFATADEVAAALAPFAGVATSLSISPMPALPSTQTGKAKSSKSRWPWLAAAVGFTVAAVAGLIWFNRPVLTIRSLRVERFRDAGQNHEELGELGQETFHANFGDMVTIEVELSRPAYAYLLAFNPADNAGNLVQLCPRADEERPPEQRTRWIYPVGGNRYRLDDGAGLQVFAVLASRQPSPSYSEWRKQIPAFTWNKVRATSGFVWRGDADRLYPPLRKTGTIRGEEVEVPEEALLEDLRCQLRTAPGIEAIGLIGFAVDP